MNVNTIITLIIVWVATTTRVVKMTLNHYATNVNTHHTKMLVKTVYGILKCNSKKILYKHQHNIYKGNSPNTTSYKTLNSIGEFPISDFQIDWQVPNLQTKTSSEFQTSWGFRFSNRFPIFKVIYNDNCNKHYKIRQICI